MLMNRCRLVLVALTTVICPGFLLTDLEAQERPQLLIKVRTDRMLLDVQVFDEAGNFVENLTAADFEILEKGEPRPVTNVLMIDKSRGVPPLAPIGESPEREYYDDRFVIVLDRMSLSPNEFARAIAGLKSFVHELPERGEAAVFVFNGRLHMLEAFTSDRKRLLKAAEKAPGFLPLRGAPGRREAMEEVGALFTERLPLGAGGIDSTALDSIARSTMRDAVSLINRHLALVEQETLEFYRSMENLVGALGYVPGNKLLILFSRGYAPQEGQFYEEMLRDHVEGRFRGLNPGLERDLVMMSARVNRLDFHEQLVELSGACNRNQVRLYGVDPTGLTTLPAGGDLDETTSVFQLLNRPDRKFLRDLRSLSEPVDSLVSLSLETNGIPFYNRNRLADAVESIFAHNSRFYVVSYEPAAGRREGKFYPIEVRLRRPGDYRIFSRNGYVHAEDGGRAGRFQSAMSFPGLFRRLPVDASAATFQRKEEAVTSLVLELPGSRIPFQHWRDKYSCSLRVFGFVFSRKSGEEAGRFAEALPLELSAEEFEQFKNKSFVFIKELQLPQGDYELRTVLESEAGDWLGADALIFSVPGEATGLELSDLVLSQDIHLSAVTLKSPLVVGRYRVVPEGNSRVRTGDPLFVYFQIYNLQDGPKGPDARIFIRLVPVGGSGPAYESGEIPVRAFTEPGWVAVSRAIPVEETGLEPGDYELTVEVRDLRSGASSIRTLEFELESKALNSAP